MSHFPRFGLVFCLGFAACKVVDVVGDSPALCDQESWAQCATFDGIDRAPFDPAQYGIDYSVHSHSTITGIGCETSGDCTPYVEDGVLSLNSEDAGYGMDVLRFQRPFDFAGREGHIHFRSDLKGQPRILQVVHVSPMISNTLPDLRNAIAVNTSPAFTVTYFGGVGQPFAIQTWRDGAQAELLLYQGDLGITAGAMYDVDIHVSRTSVRLLVDGELLVDEPLDDLGFDRGYVYVAQVSNDPAKDGIIGADANRLRWDDFAFDGPVLPRNALTPLDKQDVLFRAWDAASCTVRGVAAAGPSSPPFTMYNTWLVQLDRDAPEVLAGEIVCARIDQVGPPFDQALVGDVRVVRQ